MMDGWEQQPGGLWLKVAKHSAIDVAQNADRLPVMRRAVQTIAEKHGASFSVKGFRDNTRAITTGDLWVDFYLAKWEACSQKQVCLGAALNWETYGFDPNGRLAKSAYTEDVCILKGQLRELVRLKPADKEFPRESLAEALERISLRKMRESGAAYRYGEVDQGNTTMVRQLSGNGAVLGSHLASAVLELKHIPTDLKAQWLEPTSIMDIGPSEHPDPRNFVVLWDDPNHDVRFLVTKGRGTALGTPRADIRPWHNGPLPEQGVLNRVIASSLTAIKYETEDRKWGETSVQFAPAPLPSDVAHKRIFWDIFDATKHEFFNEPFKKYSFLPPVINAHIFIQNDGRMLEGFLANRAAHRVFGQKVMIPGVNALNL